jgi:capsular exopolysaccharide synthesis family protein
MELREYLRGLRRHWLAICLMTLVGLAAALGWYVLQTPVYQATAIGLVQTREVAQEQEQNENLILVPEFDSFARSKVPTYMEMATWRVVAEGVIADLGLDGSPSEAVSRITIENPADTNMIRVTATGSSPADAVALAEAWLQSLSAAIDDTEGDGTEGSAPVSIFVTQSAILPDAPIFPDLSTALIVGGVLGFGVGIAFALMRTASDRRIRGADGVESRTGLPVIGTIPLTNSGDSRLFDASTLPEKGARFAVSEALRSMRTNLQFMDVDNPPRAIVVTSPVPSDGKSTIACNLATTLAAGGKPVVLVDGDLRRSTIAKTMGLPGGAGLSDVLSGRAEIADVLQRTSQHENLFVLTAGSTPPNPSEVLGSERMRRLIDDLAEHATVIIDAPPLLPVTDGAVLTHQADGALVVVSLGKTTYDLLEKSLDTIAKAGGRALGVVLNRAPLKGVDSSAYSYEYRRDYGLGGAAAGGAAADTAFNLDGVFAESAPAEAARPKEKVTGHRVRRS